MARKLTSHVRAYRRRWGFTQDELAFLIGFKSRSLVAKLESLGTLPTVDIGFALYTVFGTDNTELFPSLLNEIEDGVLARAHELYERIQGSPGAMTRTKLDFLEDLFRRAKEKGQAQRDV